MTLPLRQFLTTHAAAVLVAAAVAAVVIASPQPARAAASCEVTYQKSWDNGSGFGANVTIRNTGDPITNWTLTFTFPGDQRITNGWSANWRQDGPNVTATSMPWNGNLGTGGSTGIGFNGTHGSQGNTDPNDFAINGVPCNGRPQPPTPIVSPTVVHVPEGGSSDVSVRLSGPPTANVTFVSSARDGDLDLTICGGATLVFTPANWNVPQLVRICAAEDNDFGNGARAFIVAGVPVGADEIDNEPPPIVSPTSVFPPEGGSADVSVRLSGQPAADITFNNFSGSGDFGITICVGETLVFTPANWNVPQLVRICSAEDNEPGIGVRFFLIAGVSVTALEIDNDQTTQK
ncbi:MAG TPA: cellulose-binding domain-containing protein [Candidatus Limnocylindrales bacterium]|nr:cellulose-binding domain-containing protein [Candidatus Limnocylindrales bacterium]